MQTDPSGLVRSLGAIIRQFFWNLFDNFMFAFIGGCLGYGLGGVLNVFNTVALKLLMYNSFRHPSYEQEQWTSVASHWVPAFAFACGGVALAVRLRRLPDYDDPEDA
jgi:hypothetical protein